MTSPTDSATGWSAPSVDAPRSEPVTLVTRESPAREKRLGVGLIGLDRSGQFHAECLSLRPDVEIVAACDPSGREVRRLPSPRGAEQRVYARVEDLLARTDLETVLIAGPIDERPAFALQALAAGKHVAIDSPPCANAGQIRELLAAARRAERSLVILPTRRGSIEFRTAWRIVRGNQLGALSSARLLSWSKAAPLATSSFQEGSQTTQRVDPFVFFAYQYVDQLRQLIVSPPRSVFARILSLSETEPSATAFTLSIAFEAGVDALIDVNLESGAVLQTGWMLAGTRGGYSGGRLYLREDFGEISDAPVAQTDLPEIDVYAELVEAARSEYGPADSANHAEIVMSVLDAARESSRTGQVISLDR
jgi:predicted dehydrogenase